MFFQVSVNAAGRGPVRGVSPRPVLHGTPGPASSVSTWIQD